MPTPLTRGLCSEVTPEPHPQGGRGWAGPESTVLLGSLALQVLIYSEFQARPTESWKLCFYFLGTQSPRQEAPARFLKDGNLEETEAAGSQASCPGTSHGTDTEGRPANVPAQTMPPASQAPLSTTTSAGNAQRSLAAHRIIENDKMLSL